MPKKAATFNPGNSSIINIDILGKILFIQNTCTEHGTIKNDTKSTIYKQNIQRSNKHKIISQRSNKKACNIIHKIMQKLNGQNNKINLI